MSNYGKMFVNVRVIWVPKTQEPIVVPENKPKPKVDLPVRSGRKYGECRRW